MAVLNVEHGAGAVLWTKAGHLIIFQCVSHRHVDGNKMRDYDCILAEFPRACSTPQHAKAPATGPDLATGSGVHFLAIRPDAPRQSVVKESHADLLPLICSNAVLAQPQSRECGAVG